MELLAQHSPKISHLKSYLHLFCTLNILCHLLCKSWSSSFTLTFGIYCDSVGTYMSIFDFILFKTPCEPKCWLQTSPSSSYLNPEH